MALNLNRVLLAGNLTRDPQVRFFANERAVADFGLAINRRTKSADGQQKDETTFVDCEAWGRDAELIGQYCQKGKAIFIEGRLRLDTWDDKKDGTKRSKLKIVVERFQFIDSGKGTGVAGAPSAAGGGFEGTEGGDEPAPRPSRPAPAPAAADDEPPF
jgi:single-strand DNA-binding protein